MTHDTTTLLFEALKDPHVLDGIGQADWDRLIRLARRSGVLSRLAILSQRSGSDARASIRAQHQLHSARLLATHHERSIRWSVDRIQNALRGTVSPIILLKGAAYVLADLPAHYGRLVTDVDLLFPRHDLERVERALQGAGWEPMKLNAYDQRYYRQWMHELPPLRHSTRGDVVDVHHTILPRTARLQPDARKLIDSAVPIGGGLAMLSPEDIVLHSATHLFADGDVVGGLRDLVDLDALLRHFGDERTDFWSRIVPRGTELDLDRPLFYALRYCRRWLDTPIPQPVLHESTRGKPRWPTERIMDQLTRQALVPHPNGTGASESVARWLLYSRSHWMRMPPWLLAQHLARKTVRRWGGPRDD